LNKEITLDTHPSQSQLILCHIKNIIMKTIEVRQVLNAEKEKVWNALFNDYGDIHLHNPGIIKSHNLNGATKGAIDCLRHCEFEGGMFVDEKITEVKEKESFTVTVTNSSYPPAVQEWFSVYELMSLEDKKTEVKMTLNILTNPEMIADGLIEQMKEPLGFYLIGLGYHIETGTEVTMENFPNILKTIAEANS